MRQVHRATDTKLNRDVALTGRVFPLATKLRRVLEALLGEEA